MPLTDTAGVTAEQVKAVGVTISDQESRVPVSAGALSAARSCQSPSVLMPS